MVKKIKKWMTLFLVICMTVAMIPNTVRAATQSEALTWVSSKVGTVVETDGSLPGSSTYAQCVDLIKAYYIYLVGYSVAGNGADYATNSLPSGWQRIQGASPQPGDILVYSGNSSNPYGHVAIYESDYVTYHQNFDSHPYVERITYRYDSLDNPYWGVIRPAFEDAKFFDFWGFEGGSVTGITQIWMKSEGYSSNSNVVIYVDGQQYVTLYPDSNGFYAFEFNSLLVTQSWHTLTAVLSDGGTQAEVMRYIKADNEHHYSVSDLGTEFQAYIIQTSTNKYVTNIKDNIVALDANGGTNQIWTFRKLSNGAYTISSDGYFMDVYGGGDENGTNVYPWPSDYNGGKNQQFFLYNSYGAYYIRPAHSLTRVIDINATDESYNVHIWNMEEYNPQQLFQIKKVIPVEKIQISSDWLTLKEGESSTLSIVFSPENATDKTVTWESSNSSVAKVENGQVTAISRGKAVITAKTANGKSVSCIVTVDLKKGDIDGDGTVTIFDAGLIIDMVYGRTEPDISLADLDGDGSVTIFDAGAAIDLVYGR